MMALRKVVMMGTLSAGLMAALTEHTSAAEMDLRMVVRSVDLQVVKSVDSWVYV